LERQISAFAVGRFGFSRVRRPIVSRDIANVRDSQPAIVGLHDFNTVEILSLLFQVEVAAGGMAN
jgi:hypothetical protein